MTKNRNLQTNTNDIPSSKPAMKHSTLAVIALIIVTLVWGGGFPGLAYVSRIPTFHVNAIRFLASSAILALIFHKRLKVIDKSYITSAIISYSLALITLHI